MSRPHIWLPLLLLSVLAVSACTVHRGGSDIQCEADLPGHRVGTLSGTVYEMQLLERQDMETFVYGSLPDGIDALRRGRVDAVIYDEFAFSSSELRRLGIRIAFCIETPYTTSFAFKKGDSTLVKAYNTFFQELQASGEFRRMTDFWVYSEDISPEDYPVVEAFTEGEPLRFANTETQPPLAFYANGQWQGLEIDLCRRFAAYLHRPLEISLIDTPSRLLHLQMGKADMIGGSIFITDERNRQVDFGEPFYWVRPACYVRDDPAGEAQRTVWTQGRTAFQQNFLMESRWRLVTDGLLTTLVITFWSIALGSLLGLLLCWMGLSRRRRLRAFVELYDSFMDGVPKLVLLLMMFYVVLAGSGWSAVAVAIAAFSLNFASAAGRVFRISIQEVPPGQREAGLAIGLTPVQTFLDIVWPQAVSLGLPHYRGACIDLLKDTSIVGFIAIVDVTRAADLLRSRSFDSIFPLLMVTATYFLLAGLISIGIKILSMIFRNK